jgi:hypothetical protein
MSRKTEKIADGHKEYGTFKLWFLGGFILDTF